MNKIEKKGNKNHRLRRFFILFILITIAILDFEITQNGGGIEGVISLFWRQDAKTLEKLETVHILLMGVSSDMGKELTDTMILCSYNPKQQKASMISIPRDTFIGNNKNNAKGSDKINSLYSISPQKTIDTVSKITGIDVKYYLVINTKMLVEIIDTIGRS